MNEVALAANVGDVISHAQMCLIESCSLQRGMNYRLHDDVSVLLMSVRQGSPYADRVEDEGRTLTYEGHDVPATRGGPSPKTLDQPWVTQGGAATQNALFFKAAQVHDSHERVRV